MLCKAGKIFEHLTGTLFGCLFMCKASLISERQTFCKKAILITRQDPFCMSTDLKQVQHLNQSYCHCCKLKQSLFFSNNNVEFMLDKDQYLNYKENGKNEIK